MSVVEYVYDLSAEETDKQVPGTQWPVSLLGKFQASEGPCLKEKKKVDSTIGKHLGFFSGPHAHAHTCRHVPHMYVCAPTYQSIIVLQSLLSAELDSLGSNSRSASK